MRQIIEQYKRRPFVEAELREGKVARALHWHSGQLTEEEMVAETGLSPEQIERALT